MKIKSLNLFHDILQWIWILSGKWLESIQKYWNSNTFCNVWYAAAGHVTSFMLHCRLCTYLSLEQSSLHFIFYPLPLHVHKKFKHYYNHGNHLVFKYVFRGPLVLEHKIHQQRLCTLSKKSCYDILLPFYLWFSISKIIFCLLIFWIYLNKLLSKTN